MKLISCHDGKLHALDAGAGIGGGPLAGTAEGAAAPPDRAFRTGLPALDALAPGGAFARGAVHELLAPPGDAPPLFVAAMLASAGAGDGGGKDVGGRDKGTTGHGDTETKSGGTAPLSPCPPVPLSPPASRAVVWSDPGRELYPPALAALGIPVERLFLLHPADDAEQVWAVAECLRCRGVGAVVAALPAGTSGSSSSSSSSSRSGQRLSRVQARRLQLAAERGGGVGLLLRAAGRSSAEHAAATRWLVEPAPGERNVQRWRIQLIFGHGGRVGEAVILEHHRDPQQQQQQPLRPRLAAHPVRPAAELADRPAVPPAGRATA